MEMHKILGIQYHLSNQFMNILKMQTYMQYNIQHMALMIKNLAQKYQIESNKIVYNSMSF